MISRRRILGLLGGAAAAAPILGPTAMRAAPVAQRTARWVTHHSKGIPSSTGRLTFYRWDQLYGQSFGMLPGRETIRNFMIRYSPSEPWRPA